MKKSTTILLAAIIAMSWAQAVYATVTQRTPAQDMWPVDRNYVIPTLLTVMFVVYRCLVSNMNRLDGMRAKALGNKA